MSHILRHEKNKSVKTGTYNIILLQVNSSLAYEPVVKSRRLVPVKMGYILRFVTHFSLPSMSQNGTDRAELCQNF
jgi:hypothetical protein